MRRYQDLAFRVAYVITGSAQEAEDAAQDAFVRAFRALGSFRRGAPVRPWLLTIVANTARTRRSAAARHPTLALNAETSQTLADSGQSPELATLAAEQQHELLSAICALRAEDQQVIACRYFLDLSEAETADAIGCARGTVKSRLSRALQRLRQQMAVEASTGGGADG